MKTEAAGMANIRRAKPSDLQRIAEIEVFNYRLKFYPIFRNDGFYFDELQVSAQVQKYEDAIGDIFVYDDGVVKGFVQTVGQQVRKLFVEPVLQGQSIGACLLDYVVEQQNVKFLWALEKNVRAIAFYQRHGFHLTGDKMLEEDTTEYLVRMER